MRNLIETSGRYYTDMIEPRLFGDITPERASRLPQQEFELFGFTFPILAKILPGLRTGRYMFSSRKDYAERMVPQSQEKINEILFAGYRNEDELKEGVYERLNSFQNTFHLPGLKFLGKELITPERGMNTEPVIQVLKVVEEAMEGEYRDTGEMKICHTFRQIIDVMDLVDYQNNRLLRGNFVPPFTARSTSLQLLGVALHDYVEPETKGIGDKKKVQYGRIGRVDHYPPDPHEDGVYIYRFNKENQGLTDIEATKYQTVQAELVSGFPIELYDKLLLYAKALDSTGIGHKIGRGQHVLDTVYTYWNDQKRIEFIQFMESKGAQIAKMIDASENLDTRPFRRIEGRTDFRPEDFEPVDAGGLAKKCCDTTEDYRWLERDTMLFLTPSNLLNRKLYNLTNGLITGSLFDRNLMKFFSLHRAAQMLFGIGPGTIPDEYKKIVYMY